MDRRIRATTLIVALVAGGTTGVILHARAPAAEASMSRYERLAADSAFGDSAAFAGLPRGLAELLDLRDVLTASGVSVLPSARCELLEGRRRGEARRRVELRLEDSSSVVLYVVADDSSGSLRRVEFTRRRPRQGQRGLSWDAKRDHTSSTWWTEPERGSRRRADRGDIPRGGPVPRAVRALGRQALTLPCEEARRTRR